MTSQSSSPFADPEVWADVVEAAPCTFCDIDAGIPCPHPGPPCYTRFLAAKKALSS